MNVSRLFVARSSSKLLSQVRDFVGEVVGNELVVGHLGMSVVCVFVLVDGEFVCWYLDMWYVVASDGVDLSTVLPSVCAANMGDSSYGGLGLSFLYFPLAR